MLEIEIINWDKYNPKRAQKTYSWLRLNNDIAFDQQLFGLNAAQKYAWIVILCECSRRNTGQIKISQLFFEQIVGISVGEFKQLIEFLINNDSIRVIKSVPCSSHYTALHPSLQNTTPTDGRTDETNSVCLKTKKKKKQKSKVNKNQSSQIKNIQQKFTMQTKNTSCLAPLEPSVKNNLNKLDKNTSFYISQYVSHWTKKFPNTRPALGGKEQGILKRISKDYSPQEFSDLWQVYLQMNDDWFQKKCWDLTTFEQNINKIMLAKQNGKAYEKNNLDWDKIKTNLKREGKL